MSRGAGRTGLWLVCAALTLVAPACSTRQAVTPAQSPATEAPSTAQPIALPSATLVQLLPPTSTPLTSLGVLTPTPHLVTVTAATGNLFIRRGPDLAFNPISVLRQGQSATASARDVLARWLKIGAPGIPGNTGWISIVSPYSVVSGDVSALPEIAPTEWPTLAFLRNCTHDQMVADPGGIPIPPVDAFPDNDVRINPGTYTIHDSDVDGYPSVMKVSIREGSSVDIRVDGNGEKRKCPVP